jgi:hypothetical protein
MHRTDAQRDAMREQGIAAVGIESEQHVPELARFLRQLLGRRRHSQ